MGTNQAKEDGLAGPKQVAVMHKFASESIERGCVNRPMDCHRVQHDDCIAGCFVSGTNPSQGCTQYCH
eukprot:5193590-Heterocapsa_arctica.AAC.1